MHTRISLTVLVLSMVAAPAAVAAPVPAPGYVDTLVVGGLSQPTAIAFLRGGRLLIAEKEGALKLFDGTATHTVLQLAVCSDDELGLLGVAVHPRFGSNGFIYLYLTEAQGGCGHVATRTNQIVRVQLLGDGPIDPGSLRVILGNIRTGPANNHAAGTLRIGPDRMLYASVGDTGHGGGRCPGTSMNRFAQDLAALEGKILRLTLTGGVPADNPFVGRPGARGEIFALGFRNPFRFSFDPDGGRLWAGDVGQHTVEEINIVLRGRNYSWPHCEGNLPAGCRLRGEVRPAFSYVRGGDCPGDQGRMLGGSVTGGAFAGGAFGVQQGHYVFGDFVSSGIFRAPLRPARDGFAEPPRTIVTGAGGPVDFVPGPDGAMYYVAILTGEVRRLAAVASPSRQRLTGTLLDLETAPKIARLVSDDPAITLGAANDSADDPVLQGGSIRIRTANGCGGPCDTTYPLAGWTYIGRRGANRGYSFASATGPIRSATIEPGRVSFFGRGTLLGHRLGEDPGPVDVVVRIGGRSYCLRFGGTVQYTPSAYHAENARAPRSCPAG